MTAQWYAVDRVDDVTGISGAGIVGYVLELDSGLFMFWDTEVPMEDGTKRRTHGVEWLPDLDLFDAVHGHNGATVLRAITHNQAVKARALMRRVMPDVAYTFGDVVEHLVDLEAA